MTYNEMTDALLNGGKGGTVKLAGLAGDLMAAMYSLKKSKLPVRGKIEFVTACKGRNIRKIDTTDIERMFHIFNDFTSDMDEKTRNPYVDEKGNGIIATDGWRMLLCRIPEKFPVDEAGLPFFSTNVLINWGHVAGDIEPTDYALSNYTRMATVKRGGELHGFLQVVANAVKSYAHEDEDGCLNTIRLRIGKKCYDAVGVASLVDALFKLGHDTVAVCESSPVWDYISPYTPLSLFGMGGDVVAKGLVMPLRYADNDTGAFVMPVEKDKTKAA